MHPLNSLLDLLAVLRDPERGDSWHRAQDFLSIAPCTIEEAYEVADAIDRRNMDDLCQELGDLLLQVIYHSQLAAEQGSFTFADVVSGLDRKLRSREGFTDQTGTPAITAQSRRWQQARERQRLSGSGKEHTSLLDNVPLNQPALLRAQKLQGRAAVAGFDWKDVGGVLEKLGEELGELKTEIQGSRTTSTVAHELGDVLLVCVNLARHLGVDAEAALRGANHRFEQRFRYIEDRLRERNLTPVQVTLEEMERLWQEAKRAMMAE